MKIETWIRKVVGVQAVYVTAKDFVDIVKWVGQGGSLTYSKDSEAPPEVGINVNGFVAKAGDVIVCDQGRFYTTSLSRLEDEFIKKD